jgi:dienelactone hydrolase
MYTDETRLSTAASPRLEITPEQALMDEPVRIRVLGCSPHQRVTLTARMNDDGGRRWISRATFEADIKGTVDTASHAPLDGSYSGCDPMGLFWSMTPASHPHRMDYFNHLRAYPMTFTLESNGHPITTAHLERTFLGSDVEVRPVRTEGLVGTLFSTASVSRLPGILVLGGSEGGIPEALAALLASHGYATLALAYHGVESLPRTFVEIPLEYFATALAWMRRQEQIEPDKLAVVGVSKGGELALLLGATFPAVKAVVGYAASGVVYQGRDMKHQRSSWSWQGKPVPFVPYYYPPEMAVRFLWSAITRAPTPLLPMHAGYLSDQHLVEPASIPVEQIQGPVLLFAGKEDLIWPSTLFAEMVLQRLGEHQHPYPDRHTNYEHAGHLTFPIPGLPMPLQLARMVGGTPSGNARAETLAWSQALLFLKEHRG